ncbi:Transcription termination factor like, partial [Melia azedarach]
FLFWCFSFVLKKIFIYIVSYFLISLSLIFIIPMFHFLCQTIIHGRHTSASGASKLLCLQKYTSIMSLKYISSSANQDSFTVSYLINSCGLSLESAISASKHVHFETPEKPDSVLDFLKNHGFSKTQITNLTRSCPDVLLCSPKKTLLPKFEFFYSKGISNFDLAKMLFVCPHLFRRSLQNHIIPSFNYLSNFLQSSEKTIALIKRFPPILYNGVDGYLAPKIKILRDIGVPELNILKLIDSWPRLGLTYQKYFEKNVAVVKEMGINPSKKQFVLALVAKNLISESLWERKVNVYKRWGWSEEEILTAFRKCPWIMIVSEDKIEAVMDFFVNRIGWKSSAIVRCPVVFTLSLEKRVIPRRAVFEFLSLKSLIKESTNFASWLYCSEKTFLQKFVNSYDEAPQLLNLYQEKLNPSMMPKISV